MSDYEHEIEKLLADDSFVAWIEGEASEEKASEWKEWVDGDPARKQLVKNARTLHRNLDFKATPRPEVEEELAKLNEEVDQLEAPEKGQKANVFRINRIKTYSSVAAVVLLLVTVISVAMLLERNFYQSETIENAAPKFITESTENGQQKVLTLSDGSTITLNANSSLKYPSQYSGGDLEVWLDGEAYFDIVHKTGTDKRSFTVNVSGGRVKVLGTKFNVNSYEQTTDVVLVQGRVNVEMRDSLNHTKDSYVMNPGELSRISQVNKNITTSKVEADLYTAWTRDKLVFDHTPLRKVAERVEHIYGVQLQGTGYDLKRIHVSGSLPNNNLNVFLNTLEEMLHRPVTKKNKHIIIGKEAKIDN